jgi:hypothetical protein
MLTIKLSSSVKLRGMQQITNQRVCVFHLSKHRLVQSLERLRNERWTK